MIPKRKIAANSARRLRVAENAAIGVAKARPVRTAAGIASTISGDSAAPNSDDDDVKIVRSCVSRSGEEGDVAEGDVARRDRRREHRVESCIQTRPPHDRERRLAAADCIAAAASSPGARNARYGTPPSAPRSSDDVAAEPDAHRGQEQHRRQERAEDRARHVRRYSRSRCSRTRPTVDGMRQRGHRPQSISERPVRRRKTSSSVDRRTSTLSGRSPRSWTSTATASPSSA